MQQAPPPAQSGGGGQSVPGAGGELGVNQLRAIFQHPQLAQIRDLLRANPAAITPILQQIGQTSPQLYNVKF